MQTITISKATARRFVLGRQGLWPGRRWAGPSGTVDALHAVEAVQMDPLNVVARSHDIVLWSRVAGYRPEFLDQAVYRDRGFFDYGGALFLYPMAELPYWRLPMRRRESDSRWATFAATNQSLVDEVRAELQARGPLGNRDFAGRSRVTSYRGRKDSALALFFLWLTGKVMIHHRQGFERLYDLRERIAPPAMNYAADEAAAEQFFARKSTAFMSLIRERTWASGVSSFVGRRIGRPEARTWIEELVQSGALAPVAVAGSSDRWFVLGSDVPLLLALEAGEIPATWQPLDTTTEDEAVFLAPLDIVSARGRAGWLFDFDYIWEVYKPAPARRWGYYTLPILYGDRLVARLDPKLDRATATLKINGFWLEGHAPVEEPRFAYALARGLVRFANFLEARRVNLAAVEPSLLRTHLKAVVAETLEVGSDGSI